MFKKDCVSKKEVIYLIRMFLCMIDDFLKQTGVPNLINQIMSFVSVTRKSLYTPSEGKSKNGS